MLNNYITWPAYIHDLSIFDERLKSVEDKVEQIMELLKGISNDLNGGNVAAKVQTSTRASNRATGRTIKRTEDVHPDKEK